MTHPSQLILKQYDDYYLVRGYFGNVATSKLYTYKACRELQLRPGDAAVVQARGDYGIITIAEVDVTIPDPNMSLKWVVDRVELERFNELLELESRIIQQESE